MCNGKPEQYEQARRGPLRTGRLGRFARAANVSCRRGRCEGTATAISEASAVGLTVEVAMGPRAGSSATVVSTSGEGENMRWKVRLTDDGIVTWVSDVKLLEVTTSPNEAAAQLEDDTKDQLRQGAAVQVLDGAHVGSSAIVLSSVGSGKDRRWRVQLSDGRSTWTSAIKASDGPRTTEEAAVPSARMASRPSLEERRDTQEAKMREKAEKQRLEMVQRREHYKALRPADVAAVPWAKGKEINCLSGGSGGVLLVDLGEECVALKPQGQTSANELLAQEVAPCCQVRVAQCRVVRHGEAEHQEILQLHVDGLNCPVVGAEKSTASKIFHRHARPDGSLSGRGAQLFGVLEYVPGHALMGIEAQKSLQAAPGSVWLSMGRLCALDVLINNMDRLPVPVWDNDGNLGNVMIAASDNSNVMGIDQQVNMIIPGPGRDRYLEKVRRLVRAAKAADACAPEQVLASLHQALQVNCGVELTTERAAMVLQGLSAGFEATTQSWRDGSLQSRLKEAAALCRERLSDDPAIWDQVYSEARTEMMVEFVTSVAECISNCL